LGMRYNGVRGLKSLLRAPTVRPRRYGSVLAFESGSPCGVGLVQATAVREPMSALPRSMNWK